MPDLDPKLIEPNLIPRSAWGRNLRALGKDTWFTIRDAVLARDQHRCRACGASSKSLQVHEQWAYRRYSNPPVLRLVGLVTLCQDCHRCVHVGLAAKQGRMRQVLDHLWGTFRITGSQAKRMIEAAGRRWHEDNELGHWHVDMSNLGDIIAGIGDDT